MKVKILAIIISILILALYVPVYADEELQEIPEIPSEAWEYWVVVKTSTEQLRLLSSHNPIKVEVDDEGKTFIRLNTYKTYSLSNGEWKWPYAGEGNQRSEFNVMYAANHDIEFYDGSGFFFVSPKVSPLIQTMERTDFGTILRNFSVGLIPILGCLVSIIALMKAWGFLRNQLMS